MLTYLQWHVNSQNEWHFLEFLDLTTVTQEGVYIIWHGGVNARVVRVGQGDIAARLKEHRVDAEVLRYKHLVLYVTWASVPEIHRDGVESFLAYTYHPLVGLRFPDAILETVNLPFPAEQIPILGNFGPL